MNEKIAKKNKRFIVLHTEALYEKNQWVEIWPIWCEIAIKNLEFALKK